MPFWNNKLEKARSHRINGRYIINYLLEIIFTRLSLEIKKYNSVENGYNDPQLHVDTNAWALLLKRVRNEVMKKLDSVQRRRLGD